MSAVKTRGEGRRRSRLLIGDEMYCKLFNYDYFDCVRSNCGPEIVYSAQIVLDFLRFLFYRQSSHSLLYTLTTCTALWW